MYWIYWEYHNIFTLFFIFSGAWELHTFVRSQIVAVRCFFAIYNCRNVSHSVVGCGLNFSTKKSNLVKKILATTLNDIISSFWLTIDTHFCFFLISSVLFCFIYFFRTKRKAKFLMLGYFVVLSAFTLIELYAKPANETHLPCPEN